MVDREPVVIAAVVAAVLVILLRREHVPQHTSILTGQLYCNEIIEHNNVAYFRKIARMEKESFKIFAVQKKMIFIHIVVGHSNRQTAGRWQYSGRTISIVVHEVAAAFMSSQESFFLKKGAEDPPSTYISLKRKFATYFENCIGAQDGTHIPAILKPESKAPFRNRKEKLTQNVLAVADFDLF